MATLTVVIAESPMLPVTLTLYNPLGTEPMTKNPVKDPPDIEHVGDKTRLGVGEVIVQVVSPAAKLNPDTLTVVPAGPENGVKVINGSVIFATSLPASKAKPTPKGNVSAAVEAAG